MKLRIRECCEGLAVGFTGISIACLTLFVWSWANGVSLDTYKLMYQALTAPQSEERPLIGTYELPVGVEIKNGPFLYAKIIREEFIFL